MKLSSSQVSHSHRRNGSSVDGHEEAASNNEAVDED